MLALTRKNNESIIIGDNIEVTIVEIGKGEVKIGINAPKNVPIYRKELYEDIQRSNQEALRISKNISLNELWNFLSFIKKNIKIAIKFIRILSI